jgi:hypothetical protein
MKADHISYRVPYLLVMFNGCRLVDYVSTADITGNLQMIKGKILPGPQKEAHWTSHLIKRL